MPEMTDNDSSNIFKLGKDYFVCNDSCFFRKFDVETLSTGDKFDSQHLFGMNGMSAHPLKDEKGDIYNIGFSALTGLKFSLIRVPGSDGGKSSKEMLKEAKIVCNIPSSYGAGCVSYVHSFGMTSKYIVFIEQPYVASVAAIASALIKGHSVKDWLEWRPTLKNRFHLIDKETGKLIKTEIISAKPFFFLHITNCYVEHEQVIFPRFILYNNLIILILGTYISFFASMNPKSMNLQFLPQRLATLPQHNIDACIYFLDNNRPDGA